MAETDVFLPRIRFKRATRLGKAWTTEALFPGYLFLFIDLENSWRQVHATPGVRGIVHFGQYWPTLSAPTIDALRSLIGEGEPHTVEEKLVPGDAVRIVDHALQGMQAVISQVMPARERVAVLMQLLGRQTLVELDLSSIVKEGDKRTVVISKYPKH